MRKIKLFFIVSRFLLFVLVLAVANKPLISMESFILILAVVIIAVLSYIERDVEVEGKCHCSEK